MKSLNYVRKIIAAVAVCFSLTAAVPVHATGDRWSVVPYVGVSLLGDQSANIAGADDFVDGSLSIAVESVWSKEAIVASTVLFALAVS